MATRDRYDELIKSYEFQTGPTPKRDALKRGLQQTISPEDLEVLFLLPFVGPMKPEKLARKARRKGISTEDLEARLRHLHQEAFVMKYEGKGGPLYERAFSAFMAEQQVRMRKGTELGAIYAEYWNNLSSITMLNLPTRTPYLRVVPVESSVAPQGAKQTLAIHADIEDTRSILPIDIISEMVRKEPLIGVAECYCRLSQGMLGYDCSYPRETCFTFNELAQDLIEIGIMRQVSADEAVEILRKCEDAGLIHHADNCQEHLKALCNCCPCCCPGMKAYTMGLTNVGRPSRFHAQHDGGPCALCETCVETCPVSAISAVEREIVIDTAKCIGCGHCATRCPEGVIEMALREEQAPILKTNDDLWGQIRREAVVGMVKGKLLGQERPKA